MSKVNLVNSSQPLNTLAENITSATINNATQIHNYPEIFNSPNLIISQKKAFNVENLQTWLVSKLADELELNEIDIQEPLAHYGLSSMTAVSLSGDLEELLGVKVPATVAWDYPTVESLVQYLKNELL